MSADGWYWHEVVNCISDEFVEMIAVDDESWVQMERVRWAVVVDVDGGGSCVVVDDVTVAVVVAVPVPVPVPVEDVDEQ